MLTRDEKIKLWSNGDARRAFVSNYKEWELWHKDDILQLTFYKFPISEAVWLVAMEYYTTSWNMANEDVCRSTSVKYYIHDPRGPFKPYHRMEYELTERLKKEKMRLQQEKREEAASVGG